MIVKKPRNKSLNSKVNTRIILYSAFFLLFTFYFSLSPCFSHEILSRSAVVVNASTGEILYGKNPHLRCPPASTTKLMTAIVAIEKANISKVVSISRRAAGVSPHKAGFKAGDKVTVEKLLYAALLGSANDATVALAEAVAGSEAGFVKLMNKKAAEIGAKNTRFVNSNGLPGRGQYTTAFDLSLIMKCALSYPKLKEIIGTRVTEILTENGDSIFLKNTNRLLWSDDALVGGKTGYTRGARHCFVCAAGRDTDTVIVALLGNPSREGLWKESETLISKGFEVIENNVEPLVYYSKAGQNGSVHKTSYKGMAKTKKSKKSITGKKTKYKKTKLAVKKKKAKTIAKKKRKARSLVKKKKNKRNCNIAEKNEIVRNQG
ncbi:MAG: D-alanyl-D-alanine carboxypeptidase family protein [Nitrospirota bacterium]